MVSQSQQAACRTYAQLMVEVRDRISAIDAVVAGKIALEEQIAIEFCYLQLRMICELVALGCLIAHGDITETQTARFQKDYSADRILKSLAQLHSDFFPVAMGESTPGGGNHHFGVAGGNAMSRDELIRLVAECGNALHRGDVRSLLKGRKKTSSLSEIASRAQQFADLLSIHRIMMRDENSVMLCTLKTGPLGVVQVLWAEERRA